MGRAGKQQPTPMWEKAEKRYGAREVRCRDITDKTEDNSAWPVVNDIRNHIESSLSYLDQTHPSFAVVPSRPYLNSEFHIRQAECEQAYLEYIWSEQKCQKAESRKLQSALLRNMGVTMPVFDHKKWMPSLKYLLPRQIRLDPDCQGDDQTMGWQAYYEDISLDMLQSMHPELDAEDLKKINSKAKSTLSEEDQRAASQEDVKANALVRVWHIFARNDAATRNPNEDGIKKKPDLADELQLNTPKRYIQLADGLDRPLMDKPQWPFELDHNEMPMTLMSVNFEDDDFYGFTDHAQMERMDMMSDSVMVNIENDAHDAAMRKYGGPDTSTLGEDMVRIYLEDDSRMYIPNAVDEAGKERIKLLTPIQINPSMKDSYELMHEESMRASGQSELMAENLADLKEVTALGVKYHENKLHQRVNRRLAGPRGYEQSILEDAVKILEIAHQKVPRYSVVAVQQMVEEPLDGMMVSKPQEVLQSLPWPDACKAVGAGGTLVKLGIDSIVGEELSHYWLTSEDVPFEYFRLSTCLTVVPGSTRTITNAEKVASLTDFYVNALFPTFYQPLMRFDLAGRFLKHIAQLSGSIDSVERFIPTDEEINQSVQQMQAAQAAQQSQEVSAEDQLALEQQKVDMEGQKADQQMRIESARAQQELMTMDAKSQLELRRELQQIQLEKQRATIQNSRKKE